MKKVICLILALVLVMVAIPCSFAQNDEATECAEDLYDLGLVKGTGLKSDGSPEFSLNNIPTRAEAITMLVRLLGKESEALAGKWTTPFTDVADWVKPYVGYAYAHGITTGTSATTFSGTNQISATEYLTFALTALGYSKTSDFSWDKAAVFCDEIGLSNGEYSSVSTIKRSDMVLMSSKALLTNIKSSDYDLLSTLVNSNAVNSVKANNYRTNHKKNTTKKETYSNSKYSGDYAKVIEVVRNQYPQLSSLRPYQKYQKSTVDSTGKEIGTWSYEWNVEKSSNDYKVSIKSKENNGNYVTEFEVNISYSNGKVKSSNLICNSITTENYVLAQETHEIESESNKKYSDVPEKIINLIKGTFSELGKIRSNHWYEKDTVDDEGTILDMWRYEWYVTNTSGNNFNVKITSSNASNAVTDFEANLTYENGKIYEFTLISNKLTNEVNGKLEIKDGVVVGRGTYLGSCIVIPEYDSNGSKVTKIGDRAFRFDYSVKTLQLPSSISEIGEKAFYYLEELKSINIPSSVKKIGSQAFYCCKNLSSCVFSEGLQEIGEEAFGSCPKLTTVTLPYSLSKLDESAFRYSDTHLYYPGSINELKNIWVDYFYDVGNIWVSTTSGTFMGDWLNLSNDTQGTENTSESKIETNDELCDSCHGNGYVLVSKDCTNCDDGHIHTQCSTCNGSGEVDDETYKKCTECNGTGIVGNNCTWCGGTFKTYTATFTCRHCRNVYTNRQLTYDQYLKLNAYLICPICGVNVVYEKSFNISSGCLDCHNVGKEMTCPVCHGAGTKRDYLASLRCPDCSGYGSIDTVCSTCSGKGTVSKKQTCSACGGSGKR